jgi:hypothetical protein
VWSLKSHLLLMANPKVKEVTLITEDKSIRSMFLMFLIKNDDNIGV